jgi:hypothetical protein
MTSSSILTTEWVVGTIPLTMAPPLSARLRAIHCRWMDESSEWLGPALDPDADFWNGWSAVRYINGQFDRQYRRECALIEAILPLLQPIDAFVLRARTVVLERTRRDLDQLGRRRGMTEVVSALAYRFLKLLRTWFAEIERITEELTLDELPPDGRRALAQLGFAATTQPKDRLSASHRPGEG